MCRHRALIFLAIVNSLPLRVQADDAPARTRRVRLTYSAEVRDIFARARDATLWVPFPPNNDSQEVSNIVVRSDVPASVSRDDEYGNQVLSLSLHDPGKKPVRVELQFDVLRRERRNSAVVARKRAQPPPDKEKISERWLQRDRLVPIDGKVLELARTVTRGQDTPFEQVEAIYDHTVSTLKYDKTGTGWGRGDIAYACDAKKGNCTDFHAVFVGLCRAKGIPARFEIGFSLPTDEAAGEISGYHCWADAYVSGYGWIPVDCSEAQKHPEQRDYYFGAHDENRVEFSTGRDIRLNPAQRGERLNYFVYPYAEVDGKPHEKIDRKIRYENLE
jgi:transglutaminase-like putative cysteine protease